jgi:tetratricopeptide (TPR) repeat protein
MVATAWTAGHLLVTGWCDRAGALFALVDRSSGRFGDEPAVSAVIAVVRAMFLNGSGDINGSRELRETAIHGFEQAGDRRGAAWVRISLGNSLNLLGAYARSAEMLRGALVDAERMGLGGVTASMKMRLGVALARLGGLDEARAAIGEAMEVCAASGYRRALGISRVHLAAVLRLGGALVEAEVEARRAIDELEVAPPLLPCAHATLAQVLLSRGSLPEALRSASRAVELLESLGTIEEGESLVRLMIAEAHAANGDQEAARAAILAARERLLTCADKITDPSLRESFLACVPENARTLELALQFL